MRRYIILLEVWAAFVFASLFFMSCSLSDTGNIASFLNFNKHIFKMTAGQNTVIHIDVATPKSDVVVFAGYRPIDQRSTTNVDFSINYDDINAINFYSGATQLSIETDSKVQSENYFYISSYPNKRSSTEVNTFKYLLASQLLQHYRNLEIYNLNNQRPILTYISVCDAYPRLPDCANLPRALDELIAANRRFLNKIHHSYINNFIDIAEIKSRLKENKEDLNSVQLSLDRHTLYQDRWYELYNLLSSFEGTLRCLDKFEYYNYIYFGKIYLYNMTKSEKYEFLSYLQQCRSIVPSIPIAYKPSEPSVKAEPKPDKPRIDIPTITPNIDIDPTIQQPTPKPQKFPSGKRPNNGTIATPTPQLPAVPNADTSTIKDRPPVNTPVPDSSPNSYDSIAKKLNTYVKDKYDTLSKTTLGKRVVHQWGVFKSKFIIYYSENAS